MVEDWGGLVKQGGHYFLVIPWLSSTAARTRNLPVGVAGAVGFLLSCAGETSSSCWRSLGGRTAAPSPGGIERVDSRCSRFLLARIVALVVRTNLGVLKLMLINFLSAALQQHNIRQTEQVATVRAKRALVQLAIWTGIYLSDLRSSQVCPNTVTSSWVLLIRNPTSFSCNWEKCFKRFFFCWGNM